MKAKWNQSTSPPLVQPIAHQWRSSSVGSENLARLACRAIVLSRAMPKQCLGTSYRPQPFCSTDFSWLEHQYNDYGGAPQYSSRKRRARGSENTFLRVRSQRMHRHRWLCRPGESSQVERLRETHGPASGFGTTSIFARDLPVGSHPRVWRSTWPSV